MANSRKHQSTPAPQAHPVSVLLFVVVLLIVFTLGALTMWYNIRRPVETNGADVFKVIKNRFDRLSN